MGPVIRTAGEESRTDVRRYLVYREGKVTDELLDLKSVWQDDLVSFLLGCSFSFEHALIENGIKLPHWETDKNVAMFRTSIQTVPSGPFSGPMVVSMRWIPQNKVVRAVQATTRFPSTHGAPVHVGDPQAIGIADPMQPDFGDAWEPADPSDVPVFWACGVTPQAGAGGGRHTAGGGDAAKAAPEDHARDRPHVNHRPEGGGPGGPLTEPQDRYRALIGEVAELVAATHTCRDALARTTSRSGRLKHSRGHDGRDRT